MYNHHGIVVCGHRGGAIGFHLENTLGAFSYAIDNKVEMIEFDVSLFNLNTIDFDSDIYRCG